MVGAESARRLITAIYSLQQYYIMACAMLLVSVDERKKWTLFPQPSSVFSSFSFSIYSPHSEPGTAYNIMP